MTEQERKDIQEALIHYALSLEGLEYEVAHGLCDEQTAKRFKRIYIISAQSLRRWLDEDREDREHDEA